MGNDEGVFGCMTLLGCHDVCPKQLPLQTQIAFLRRKNVVAQDTPKGKGAQVQELAEKYTNGKVKVEVYANSTLYKDKEELEALQLGAVQMLAPSNSKFGPIGVKEFEVFDLPVPAARQGGAAPRDWTAPIARPAEAARVEGDGRARRSGTASS